MYRAGAISAGGTFFKAFLGTFGSGVARELSATPAGLVAALDSRFFNDSFFVRFSRAMAPVSSGAKDFRALVSGFKGDDTAGTWSSSSARFWGREGIATGAATGTGTETGTGVAGVGVAPPAPEAGEASVTSSVDILSVS